MKNGRIRILKVGRDHLFLALITEFDMPLSIYLMIPERNFWFSCFVIWTHSCDHVLLSDLWRGKKFLIMRLLLGWIRCQRFFRAFRNLCLIPIIYWSARLPIDLPSPWIGGGLLAFLDIILPSLILRNLSGRQAWPSLLSCIFISFWSLIRDYCWADPGSKKNLIGRIFYILIRWFSEVFPICEWLWEFRISQDWIGAWKCVSFPTMRRTWAWS